MDAAQYMQQCEQEDQAQLNAYMSRHSADPVSSDTDEQIDDSKPSYAPPQTFNVSTNLIRGCALPNCPKANNLSHCSACKAVQYCSQEHRNADRPGHRMMCNKVKKAQLNFEKEAKALRRLNGDDFFDRNRGRLMMSRRAGIYIHSRVTFVYALLKFNTIQAVNTSLENLLDLLELCGVDGVGARDVIPGLLLRLDHDLDAYVFCKWWTQNNEWDHDDIGTPYLDSKDANVFEDVKFLETSTSLSHLVAITLLKIRLMISLQNLQRAKQEAGPLLPRELLDNIRQYCASSAITRDPKMLERDDHTAVLRILRSQVKNLYAIVKEVNPHLWPALLHPGDHLSARPTRFKRRGLEHMQLILQYS